MLAPWMPHSTPPAATPIFRYATRRLRWANTPAALTRYLVVITAIASAALLLLWGLVVWIQLQAMQVCLVQSNYYCEGDVFGGTGTVVTIAILAAVGAGWLMDFACVFAAFNSIRGRVNSAHWDLLRLTPMQRETIIEAEYSVAQARAWRSLSMVLGLRIAALVLLLAQVLLLPPAIERAGGQVYNSTYADPGLFLIVVGFILFFAVYLVEPFWRMRAVTALGLAVAALFRGIIPAALTAFALLVAMWIAQVVIMGVIFWCSISAAFGLQYAYPPCASLVTGGIIYGFYLVVRQEALKRAVRYAFIE